MDTLHLAADPQVAQRFAAFAPQPCGQGGKPYISGALCSILKAGYTQVTLPLRRCGAGRLARHHAVVTDRRRYAPAHAPALES